MKKIILLLKALVNKTPVVEIEVNDTLSTNVELFMNNCKEQIAVIEEKIATNAANGKTYTAYCNFDLTVDVKNVICEYFEKAGYTTDRSCGTIGIKMPIPATSDVEDK